MTDRVFVHTCDWALGADEVQWILYRRRTRHAESYWQPVSFVRSTRDILARCMREKGVEAETARSLLFGLPATFDEWHAALLSPKGSRAHANEGALP